MGTLAEILERTKDASIKTLMWIVIVMLIGLFLILQTRLSLFSTCLGSRIKCQVKTVRSHVFWNSLYTVVAYGGGMGGRPPWKLRGRPPGKLGDALPPGWKSVGSYYLSLNHGHKWPEFEIIQNPVGGLLSRGGTQNPGLLKIFISRHCLYNTRYGIGTHGHFFMNQFIRKYWRKIWTPCTSYLFSKEAIFF